MVHSPWRANTDLDFEEACTRCEKVATIQTAAQHKRLIALLHFDKRPQGSRGRTLLRDFGELSLKAGDRLEPGLGLVDIGMQFDMQAEFPFLVTFWRTSEQSLCLRRCPLFDPRIGVTPCRSIALDLLHTLHLGVMKSFCAFAIWRILKSSIWGGVQPTEAERVSVAMLSLRAELGAFFVAWARDTPGELLTRITDITPKMLGTENDPRLKLKGGET